MRGAYVIAGVAAALGYGLVVFAPSKAAQTERELCRRPPELVRLPAEVAERQGSQSVPSVAESVMPSPMTAPPPPPPPPAVAPDEAGDIVVTGSRGSASERSEAPPPVVASDIGAMPDVGEAPTAEASRYRPTYNAPPPGLLTAGDHDDLLNPLLYARYVNRAARELGQQVTDLPRVDTRQAITVAVQDGSGRAAPFVPVIVTCSDGNQLKMATVGDGTVVLFPQLDRLGEQVRIQALGASRSVNIGKAAGGQQQTLVINQAARPVTKLDLVIALDATGSMGDEIEFLKSELQAIVSDLRRGHSDLDIRVGLVTYRDEGDTFVTRTDPLSHDFSIVQRQLDRTRGEGGGDMPEAMDQALIRAVGQQWRPDAVKSLLLVADAPPHDELYGRAFAAADAARSRRIQIVPVAASGVDDRAQYFMRAVAAATQSRYIVLTDDSGIGNAHAEPDVDCYVVTSLASAIRRVLASQIGGVRVEPYPQEVIRTLGRYDHGKCILPTRFSVDEQQ